MSTYSQAFLNQLLKEFLSHKNPSQVHSYVQSILKGGVSKPVSAQKSSLDNAGWNESTLDFEDQTEELLEEDITKTFSPEQFEAGVSSLSDKSEKLIVELGDLHPVTQDVPYVKIGVLGKGGMGLVMRVEDPSLHRLVALKQLKSRSDHEVDAFKREAEITAKLQHPGIIPIYEYGVLDDGSSYFTMQEVRGRTLNAIIKDIHHRSTKASWSLRKVMGIFKVVCETMAYAHSQGVLHRDLKPQNIMVGQFGEVYVVDWGIAVMTEASVLQHFSQSSVPVRTQTSGIAGTPIYMSPEQARGDVSAFTSTSDIYSLGAILFKILTGTNVISGDIVEIMKQKRNVFTVSLAAVVQEQETEGTLPFGQHIPPTLISVCEKALEFDPDRRYQSCLEFANAIQDWLDGVERKLRALKILVEIEEIEDRQRALALSLEQKIEQINQELIQDRADIAWQSWREQQDISQRISKNTQKIKQLLQTSLIFDSENHDVYEKLFSLEYQLIQEAQRQRNILAQDIAKSTLSLYLEILPKDIQNLWLQRLQRQEQMAQTSQRLQHQLIGRNQLVQDILGLLQTSSLVSLVGAAGMGKTHLSLALASQWSEQNQADTIFCDITEARDRDSLLLSLGAQLEIPLTSRPQHSIIQALRNRGRILLVLDNCEQVVVPLREFLEQLHAQAENVTLLITSRTILNISSEQVVRLPKIRLIDGMYIFINRAKKVRSNVELDAQQFAAIARIVQRLEQVPLAIQLAAARSSTLSIADIDLRLQESFSLLRSKLRTDQPEALQSALDWSWELLSVFGKKALVQCAWFKNGFTLEAAEQILAFTQEDSPEVYELIEALVDDSLLRKEYLDDGRERYMMLTSIREHARQKLALFQQEDESMRLLSQRHASYYAQQGQNYLTETIPWREAIIELDNFILAAAHGRPADIGRCARVSLQIIDRTGPWSLGLELIQRALQKKDISVQLRNYLALQNIRYLRMIGQIDASLVALNQLNESVISMEPYEKACFAREQGHQAEAQSKLKEALSYYQQANLIFKQAECLLEILQTELDCIDILIKLGEYQTGQARIHRIESAVTSVSQVQLSARYYQMLGTICQNLGDYTLGMEHVERALFYNEKTQDMVLQTQLIMQQGVLFVLSEQYEQAIVSHQKILHLIRKIGDKRQESRTLITLGVCYKNLKQYQKAEEMYRMALVINEEIGHQRGLAIIYLNISQILPFLGRDKEVEQVLQKALELTAGIEDQRLLALFHSNLGRYYFEIGTIDKAELHYQKSVDINREIGHRKGWALNLGNYANCLKQASRWSEAEAIYKKAIMMCLEMNVPIDGFIIKGNLGDLYWEKGDYQQAKEVLSEVYTGAEKKNVKIIQAVFGATLALIYAAEKRFAESYQILRDMEPYVKDDKSEYLIFLSKKAWIYQLDNQPKRAKEVIVKLQKQAEDIRAPKYWAVRLLLQKFWTR